MQFKVTRFKSKIVVSNGAEERTIKPDDIIPVCRQANDDDSAGTYLLPAKQALDVEIVSALFDIPEWMDEA